MSADNHAQPAPGHMDITEQTSTYHVFDGLVRWGGLGVASIVLFLTLLCCTKAGFIGAAVPTAVMLGAGFWFLRAPTSLETH